MMIMMMTMMVGEGNSIFTNTHTHTSCNVLHVRVSFPFDACVWAFHAARQMEYYGKPAPAWRARAVAIFYMFFMCTVTLYQ